MSIEQVAGGTLLVRVNDELTLDAGTWETSSGPHGEEFVIRPPERTLFRQVFDFLTEKPDPPLLSAGSVIGREGVAAAALTLRWGSYLAVLADRDKPVWPVARCRNAQTTRIADQEMARINIEASAAMAEWVDFYREHSGMGLYTRIVQRAIAYLPMPRRSSKREAAYFAALSDPGVAARVIENAEPEHKERAAADAEQYPSRIFSNALVNVAWRNGPAENIHAGKYGGFPIDQRRVTPGEEGELMRFATDRMATGMTALLHFASEGRNRTWSEQVLPYGLSWMLLVTPTAWTLTESSREVRLRAWELGTESDGL